MHGISYLELAYYQLIYTYFVLKINDGTHVNGTDINVLKFTVIPVSTI